MRRLRAMALLAACAGFVWMLFARAAQARLSDIFWIDLAYNVAAVAVAVVVVTFIVSFIGRLFHPPVRVQLVVAASLILAIAAADVFWLREMIAQP